MTILFVISTLKAGGAERVCALLASKFSQFHDVALLKFDESKPFYELDERVRLLNLAYGTDELGIFGNFKKRLGKIFAIRKIIKNENTQVYFNDDPCLRSHDIVYEQRLGRI